MQNSQLIASTIYTLPALFICIIGALVIVVRSSTLREAMAPALLGFILLGSILIIRPIGFYLITMMLKSPDPHLSASFIYGLFNGALEIFRVFGYLLLLLGVVLGRNSPPPPPPTLPRY